MLDLDILSGKVLCALLAMTVRYCVPSCEAQITAAVRGPGGPGEGAALQRRPDNLAGGAFVKSFSRLGPTALKHSRGHGHRSSLLQLWAAGVSASAARLRSSVAPQSQRSSGLRT